MIINQRKTLIVDRFARQVDFNVPRGKWGKKYGCNEHSKMLNKYINEN